jgi:2-hydroxymuconate-semialdehyde hydrolase
VNAGLEAGSFVDVRGIRTHFHEAGAGIPVVLVHGSGPGVTAWANWRLALPYLAERGFHVFAFDLVGFGYTASEPGVHYGMKQWLEHLIAFIESVVPGKKANVVGNSLGGAIAIALAVRRPELLERMVLMGSGGLSFPLTTGLDRVWGYEPSEGAMRKLIVDYFAYDSSFVTDDLVRARYQASIQPGFQEQYASLFPQPRQRWIESIATPEKAIRAITTPTLLFHGREDKVIPLEVSYRLLSMIPEAQLHVFGHCGHWTQVERAADFNALVAHFFNQVQPL